MKCGFKDWGIGCSSGAALGTIIDNAIKFYSLVAVASFVKFCLNCENLKKIVSKLGLVAHVAQAEMEKSWVHGQLDLGKGKALSVLTPNFPRKYFPVSKVIPRA